MSEAFGAAWTLSAPMGRWTSEQLDCLIGCVPAEWPFGGARANHCSVWEWRNTVCALFFSSCFHVFMFCSSGTRPVDMSIQDEFICARCMFSMLLFLSEILKFHFDRK